jgi:SAM-dependent methyltransferase
MTELPTYIAVTRDFYETNAERYASTTSGMLDLEWLERFSALLPKEARILDVGSAGGRDSAWLAERGFQVTGIDIAPTFVDMAKRSVPAAEFRVMSITALDFPDESFAGVWCSCVLIHLTKEGAARALREIRRVLSPKGPLFILVKAGLSEGFEGDPRYNDMKKYSSYYSEEELRGLLDGFDVVTVHSVDKPVDTYRAPDRLFVLATKAE